MKRLRYGNVGMFFLALALAVCVASVISLTVGHAGMIRLGDLSTLLTTFSPEQVEDGEMKGKIIAFWQLRMHRTALAILVGLHLALAGAIMQALFYNPLAEPYVAGVSSGAALGGVIAMTLGVNTVLGGINGIGAFAFVGAAFMSGIVYFVARRAGRISMASLLLTGIALGGLAQAGVTLLVLRSDPYNIRSVLAWLMGSLANKDWNYVLAMLPYTVIGLVVAIRNIRTLNALATGEESAHYLGVSVGRARIVLLMTAALLASSAVAAVGIVGFVGLIVPHIVRMAMGANHRVLIPASALLGACVVLCSDVFARVVMPGAEIPIGIVTCVIGSFFFLILLKSTQRRLF